MKLLPDQNLSHHLIARLADAYPDAQHVRHVGLASATDDTVWRFAAANGFTIVSKDSDFHQRSPTLGPPPKVVWLRIGNAPTIEIEELFRRRKAAIRSFGDDREGAFLALE